MSEPLFYLIILSACIISAVSRILAAVIYGIVANMKK